VAVSLADQTTREGALRYVAVIVQHVSTSVNQYPAAGLRFPLPERCPTCQAVGRLIRWGFYRRWLFLGPAEQLRIRVQRVRCQECGHTHSLLPDFTQAYRRYTLEEMQRAVLAYLFLGLGWRALQRQLAPAPPLSTVREWLASFAYGAGERLFPLLLRQVQERDPLANLSEAPPPAHLDRVPDLAQRRRLQRAHRFYLLAEQLYAQVKTQFVRLHFSAAQLFRFLLHWLQTLPRDPRLFYAAPPTGPVRAA
jgi:transposase-like protein